jgi:tetratricopeptide (TPR) repeat protein
MANAIKNGNSRAALNVVNRALKQKGLSEDGRVLFLKYRANIYLLFNQPKRAQRDLDEIKELDGRLTSDYLLLQARAWAAQNKELDSAYDYAMTLVKRNTVDVIAWDILGVIVEKREGVTEALELLERIGDISNDTSSLFEHLGDMYRKTGDKKNAIKSYMRALELSDDGMVVVPFIEKKLRKLK